MGLGPVHRGAAVLAIWDETSSRCVQMIEVGTREAKAAVAVAGSDRRTLELERGRARARIPQVVRRREGEGTAVAARVREPGPRLAVWTDARGLAFRESRSKVDQR